MRTDEVEKLKSSLARAEARVDEAKKEKNSVHSLLLDSQGREAALKTNLTTVQLVITMKDTELSKLKNKVAATIEAADKTIEELQISFHFSGYIDGGNKVEKKLTLDDLKKEHDLAQIARERAEDNSDDEDDDDDDDNDEEDTDEDTSDAGGDKTQPDGGGQEEMGGTRDDGPAPGPDSNAASKDTRDAAKTAGDAPDLKGNDRKEIVLPDVNEAAVADKVPEESTPLPPIVKTDRVRTKPTEVKL